MSTITISPRIAVVKTITPTRIGMGQASGLIDLPVIREVITGWPVLPGSSIKGVLRDHARARLMADGKSAEDADSELAPLFGGEDNAGKLVLTDLSLLLFPVRSLYGVYALGTCPLALLRVKRLLALRGSNNTITIPAMTNEWPPDDRRPVAVHAEGASVVRNGEVQLEDLELDARDDAGVPQLAAALANLTGENVENRLLVLDDSLFTYLAKTATEQRTRTALELETKTAKDKSLRTEEYVPPESVFVGYYELPQEYWDFPKLQIGAEASVGAGIIEWRTL